ncbi:hypothetical protein [Massilia antarctica]|uniref:hypothetical protein n=1 Tax=Massilia antarctica TaxID=2765360 RepID=UPI0006BB7645|nr:hypothetical protein [Massilia sp. H27-R4]MCY0911256.1 hypothetical protein [Massilia sp. H27-R4]CUI05149.1 hypothetical protein BN2497_5075 [Janthinobacterium sp. CG23_2]CUU28935.1 hypothetical protein BN3177_5075 [Janthinobacterium sp. CG23_2]
MNKLRAAVLLALAGCAAVAPMAKAAPATEAQWIAAATEAVAYGRAQGLPIDLEVVDGNGLPGHTPVGLSSENGRCTLVVSASKNPTADKLSSMIAPDLLEPFLAGAAMHEVGHCHRRLHGFPHNEKLLPVVAWIAPLRDWFARRVRTEEAYADMTSVAWIARFHPERYTALVNEMLRVRTRFREPKHDTVALLERALAEGPQDANENLFALADERLNRYR